MKYTLEDIVKGSKLYYRFGGGSHISNVCSHISNVSKQHIEILRINIRYILDSNGTIISIEIDPKIKAKIAKDYEKEVNRR